MPTDPPLAAAIDPPLTPAQRLALARRALAPPAQVTDAPPVGGGTVNEVWRLRIVGDGIAAAILRVAPSPRIAAGGPSWMTAEGLRREQAAIALLPHLSSILPRTVCFDGSREIIDRDWVVQSLVPGTPWSEVDSMLDDGQRIGLWRQMGAICRAIHEVRGTAFGPAHAPLFATWADLVLDDARGLLEDAERFGVDTEPFIRLAASVEANRAVLDRVDSPRLIHSDLGPRHCFVASDADGQWQIIGLIDLEFARFADPRSESAIELFDRMPPDDRFHEAFSEGYGPFVTPPGAEVRAVLYGAIALGWAATDMARLGARGGLADVIGQMTARLERIPRSGIR